MFNNKSILITGGTGSFGNAAVSYLTKKYNRKTLVSIFVNPRQFSKKSEYKNYPRNKFKDVRAAICHDTYSAGQGVEHDDMNVICLGGRIVGEALAKEIVSEFLESRFISEDRFIRRKEKLDQIEKENLL